MSRTYKYPRESLEGIESKDELDANMRIKKRIEKRKQLRKKKIKTARSLKKFISFRDKQRARV